MPASAERFLLDRSIAAVAVILFHVAVIAALLYAMAKFNTRKADEHETVISLARIEKPIPVVSHGAARGQSAVTPYNYAVIPPVLREQPNLRGLALALSSCAPEKLGDAPAEVRAACDRIGMVIAANPEAFGVNTDFTNGKRWQRELLIKQTPLLLPCASPYGVDILYTLFCVADVVGNGYDPDKMLHYQK
jgi:hypothetical protein